MSALSATGDHDTAAIHSLVVLADLGCPMCARFARWLSDQPQVVPIEIIAAASPVAVHRFPQIDPADMLRELVVVADTGQLWRGASSWVTCLWATGHDGLARWLSTPAGLPMARAAAYAAAGIHARTTSTRVVGPTGYGGCRDGSCDTT